MYVGSTYQRCDSVSLFVLYVVPKALVSVGSSYYYGEQEEPILMSHLLCNGDEESLNSCPHRRFGQHSCYSGDIAGIMCSNGTCFFLSFCSCS